MSHPSWFHDTGEHRRVTDQREDLGMCKEGASEKHHWHVVVPPMSQSPIHRGTGKTSTKKVVTIVQEQEVVVDG